MVQYICSNLNSIPNSSTNHYWYKQFSNASKAFIVAEWRRKKDLISKAKFGETICNDSLVNYLKAHKSCICAN